MEIRNLTFSYTEQSFMKDFNGTIEKGKITTILGPNGCGKSTLLNLLINQLKPERGEILLEGSAISKIPRKEMAKQIAMVHQQNCVPADTTVERLVRFGRMPHQTMLSSKDEAGEETVRWALEETNLTHMAKKRVGRLSGGECQRAWIAMALAQKTDLLFLDEPTTYLDIFYQLEILNLVRRLNREYGMTIVMVLHDINQAIQFSDRLIIMKKGKVCYAGDVKNGITQERLKEVYGIRARVHWSEENHCPYIVPIAETGKGIEVMNNQKKILITYSSKTGNTKKVAEGIYEGLEGMDRELLAMSEVETLADYDIVLAGYWVDKGAPNTEAAKFLETLKHKKVGLFATLAFWPDSEHAYQSLQNGEALVKEQNHVIGKYICQGKIDEKMVAFFEKMPEGNPHKPTPEKRKRYAISANHPSAADIAAAAEMFRERIEADV